MFRTILKKVFGLITTFIFVIIFIPFSDVALTSCNNCQEASWGYSNGEFSKYSISQTKRTRQGIIYDDSDLNIDPDTLDRLTNEVEQCLEFTFPQHLFTEEVKNLSICDSYDISLPIDRSSFYVKVANDWVYSCDKTQELLPDPVIGGSLGCQNKGLIETDKCSCRWRAGIKCPNILVVTPSLYLYKDVLIRFIGSCKNPWGTNELAMCATPTTNPLSIKSIKQE